MTNEKPHISAMPPLLSLLAALVILPGVADAQSRCSMLLGAEKPWRTICHIIDAEAAGPVVMIVGGVHGNEPAGARAADEIRCWTITRGRLIVIPRANEIAFRAAKRLTPDTPPAVSNLNRNFPKASGGSPACELSRAIWEMLCAQRPDWLIDLHEGYDFTQLNGDSVGSSIIASDSPPASRQARRMLDALNVTITDPNKQFILKGPPVDGSLARAAAEHLDATAMTLETTFKNQPVSLRNRQHRIMVHRLLSDLGMVEHGPDVLVEPDMPENSICAAIYDGRGVGARGPAAIEKDLSTADDIITRRIDQTDIAAGVLSQFDILIMPGGSASRQAAALGDDGCRQIVQFVKDGGGYAGFCAGAYLASNNYTWSLKLIDARVIDREHWKRGTGTVEMELTALGRRRLLDDPAILYIHYANGPILAPDSDPNIPDFEPLAHFRTAIAANGAPQAVMENTPAVICGSFGAGRVLCSSPHPEYTDGLEPIVRAAVRWAATAPGRQP